MRTTRHRTRTVRIEEISLLGPPSPRARGFVFPRAARSVFRRRRGMMPSEWNERYQRHVPQSSRAGAWKNESAPYLAGIMDAHDYPSVRETDAAAPPQTGKSEAMFAHMCYVIDRDPGPMMYVMQTDVEAREMSKDRIRPMLENTPKLARYFRDAGNEGKSALRIALEHMPLYLSWGTSVNRAASKPIRYLYLDEEDKYPVSHTLETNPVRLFLKRVRTFPNHKIFRACSPTRAQVGIWAALGQCEVLFRYHVRCPDCGRLQVMEFKRVRVPEGERDRARIEGLRLAWYECAGCGSHWNDAKRDEAVRRGKWMTGGVELFVFLRAHNPRRIGFHYSALISSFVSLSETMGVWFEAQGDRNALRDFFNGYLAEPWVDYQAAREEDSVLALCDERPRDLVPGYAEGRPEVAGLLLAADTQDNGLYYLVRAFGYGQERESWLVRHGFLPLPARHDQVWRAGVVSPDFRALERILEREFRDAEGRPYYIHRAIVDCQGHRTREVYDFCRRHLGRVWPWRGEQRQQRPVTVKPVRVEQGLMRIHADTNFWKDDLASKLAVAPGDPGAFHLLEPRAMGGEYATHLAAEFVNDKGLWECPENRANHYWDCEVMALALWDFLEGELLERPEPERYEPPTEPGAAVPAGAALAGRPDWFYRPRA